MHKFIFVYLLPVCGVSFVYGAGVNEGKGKDGTGKFLGKV